MDYLPHTHTHTLSAVSMHKNRMLCCVTVCGQTIAQNMNKHFFPVSLLKSNFNQCRHIYLQLLFVILMLQFYGQQSLIHSHMLPTQFLREICTEFTIIIIIKQQQQNPFSICPAHLASSLFYTCGRRVNLWD